MTPTAQGYALRSVEVTARSLEWGATEVLFSKEDLHRVLAQSEVELVRKGAFLASDVYMDGFAGGTVEIVIDGERFPNSCPRRMDPPAARVNPLEMARIQVDKSSAQPQSGIGGKIAFERARPAEAWTVRGGVTGRSLVGENVDAALALEGHRHRITGRILSKQPYEDARGRAFDERYGYVGTPRYHLYETSLSGEQGPWQYDASLLISEDIPFPYLQMDERENVLWSASAGYGEHKVYVNHTHHLMDNDLRSSSNMMGMETDASNFTLGASGPFYEAYYRRWDAWNTMDMGMKQMRQHLMPDLRMASATASHTVRWQPVSLSAKVGLTRIGIADEGRLDLYRQQFAGANAERWFVPFSAVARYTHLLARDWTLGLVAEVASEAPIPEQMYIALKRPGNKPMWTGNPTLDAPIKTTLRGSVQSGWFTGDVYATHVHDFAGLVATGTEAVPVVTYDEIDAFMAGVNMRAAWPLADVKASYTWAHNRTHGEPLAETPSLRGQVTFRTPVVQGLQARSSVHAAAAQGRVAERLGEMTTPAWARVDLGLSYALREEMRLTLDVENVTDALYHRHLSYLRDPFSSGLTVFEPGRTLRLGLQFEL
jgi:iron complex outermembrane receptor protein